MDADTDERTTATNRCGMQTERQPPMNADEETGRGLDLLGPTRDVSQSRTPRRMMLCDIPVEKVRNQVVNIRGEVSPFSLRGGAHVGGEAV